MLTSSGLIGQLRPLLHPMIVHFPIALLYASIALDWLGYVLKLPNLTRAGFYTLILGAFGAGIAALTGPDHAVGDPSVSALLAAHQNFACLTVALAVTFFLIRFFATNGLGGKSAGIYLLLTLVLLVSVSLTGYYGGEMTYHHAVGVTGATVAGNTAASVSAQVYPLLPAKPFVALVGFLAAVVVGGWLLFGRRFMPEYASQWWRAVKREVSPTPTRVWTLWRGREGTGWALAGTRNVAGSLTRDDGTTMGSAQSEGVSPRR